MRGSRTVLVIALLAGAVPPPGAGQGRAARLEARHRQLAVLRDRGGPEAGPELVELLRTESDGPLRRLVLQVLRAVVPTGVAPALGKVAAAEPEGEVKKELLRLQAFLERAAQVELSSPPGPAAAPAAEDLASLRDFLAPWPLVVAVLDRAGAPVADARVKVWSGQLGLWLPRPESQGATAAARTDDHGRTVVQVPAGPLVVAAWTPGSLVWSRLEGPLGSPLVLRPEAELVLAARGGLLHGWPAGPWPDPGFPAWRAGYQGAWSVQVGLQAPLDLLLVAEPPRLAGDVSSRRPGRVLFLKAAGPGLVPVPALATVAVAGSQPTAMADLRLTLAPAHRPDLAKVVPLPPGGGAILATPGEWRASLSWRPAAGGTLAFHPRGLRLGPGDRVELATLPLSLGVYARREARLGLARDVLSLGALATTPDGSVLRSWSRPRGSAAPEVRVRRGEELLGTARLDERLRATLEGLAPAGKQLDDLCFEVQLPFFVREQLLVRRRREEELPGRRFRLVGPPELALHGRALLAMADAALARGLALSGRRPQWSQVPVVAHLHLPPGVGASAGGGDRVPGALNFTLASLLEVVHPGDILRLPWLHEVGHKLGYPHDAGMLAQTVALEFALAGEEGVNCAGRSTGETAWRLLQEGGHPRWRQPAAALALIRRRCGERPLERFLAQEGSWRPRLEGEGIPEGAAAAAALCFYTDQRIDGLCRALGWEAPEAAVAQGLALLAQGAPPRAPAPASGSAREARRRRLESIPVARERAAATLQTARQLGPHLDREELKELLSLAQRAAALAGGETWRNTRRAALTLWAAGGEGR